MGVNDVAPTALTYSTGNITATKGTPVTSVAPTVTGTGITFSVSPALPAGLTIDPITGVISGTPTVVLAPAQVFTVSATNSGGTTTFPVTLGINEVAPTDLNYSTGAVSATVGTPVIPTTPTITGTGIIFSVSPALPAGLSINPITGVISGTPTVALKPAQVFTVTASNSGGTSTFPVTLGVNEVAPAALTYSTGTVTGTIGTPVTSVAPTVTGTGITFSVSPALPVGLTIDPKTGVISGTPTVALSPAQVFTVTATNSSGSSTFPVTLGVDDIALSALIYSTGTVTGTVGTSIVPNTPTVTGSGITFSVSPALPVGLTLNPTTGVISGTPTVTLVPAQVFTVTATNSVGNKTFPVTLGVNDLAPTALTYSTGTVTATKGTTITTVAPTVTGAGITFSVSPALPVGLSINPTTGIISGVPTVTLIPAVVFTVTATNSGGKTTFPVTLGVNDVAPAALTYSTGTATATLGTPFTSVAPTVTGSGITFSVSPALPVGLTLNPTTGVISGTPTVTLVPAQVFTVTATNSGGKTTFPVTLGVNEIAPTALSYSTGTVTGTIGSPVTSVAPTVTGTGITFSVSPALPAGLTLNPTTGVISGTPTVTLVPAQVFTVTATNSGGKTTFPVTLGVNDVAPVELTFSMGTITTTIGNSIIPNIPTVTGSGITFSVSPVLPAGVIMNAKTGVVTGTPTGLLSKTIYTITATNSGGSVSQTFSLEVTPTAPTANPFQAVCGSGTVSDLVATAPAGTTVRWYNVATGGTSLITATALTATTYYAESWSGTVASSSRIAVLMIINVIPAKPVLVPASTAKRKIKLCPGDNIVCSNFNNTLSYQWKLNGTDLTGQTTNQYQVLAGGAGTYSLYVKNPATGCDMLSSSVTVDLYAVTTPVIYEKKKSEYISILIVDNRSNLYSSYLWTFSDGTALPSTIVNDRQFLVLPPNNMTATYMVNITDSNSCTIKSSVQNVVLKTIAAKAYPTLNNGNFRVSLTDAQDGKLIVQIFSLSGVLERVYTFDNVSSELEYQINAAGLKTGSYTVEISLGDYVQTQKMIIQ